MSTLAILRSDELLAYFAAYEWELLRYGTVAITLLAATAVGVALLFPPVTAKFVQKHQAEVIRQLRLNPKGIGTDELSLELLLSRRNTLRLMRVLEKARVVSETPSGWRLVGL